MPSDFNHIRIANKFQTTINFLLTQKEQHAEWITTIAFYKALHIIEAVFYNQKSIRHGHNHEDREQYLKRDNKFKNIFKHYRPLWAASTVARYLEDQSRKKDYGTFHDYLPIENIEPEILNHRLRQIEKTAKKFLSKKASQQLK